jgi:predicted nucleic acid-binding protein
MQIYYLDASALAKHYLSEPGSRWISDLLQRRTSDRFVSAELVTLEVVSAIARAQRERRISIPARNGLAARALEEARHTMRLVSPSQPILGYANQLVLRYPLRAYDAVHLATAIRLLGESSSLTLPSPVFVSADANLLAAARAEGLMAENPSEHE